MNLYTILIDFEDRTMGIDQFEGESVIQALEKFVLKAESLDNYDRQLLLSIIHNRSKQDVLLTHIAYLKGFWIINFGVDLIDNPGLSEIFGGYIIQTDIQGPVGIPKLPK
jgi:hypothetical protein